MCYFRFQPFYRDRLTNIRSHIQTFAYIVVFRLFLFVFRVKELREQAEIAEQAAQEREAAEKARVEMLQAKVAQQVPNHIKY